MRPIYFNMIPNTTDTNLYMIPYNKSYCFLSVIIFEYFFCKEISSLNFFSEEDKKAKSILVETETYSLNANESYETKPIKCKIWFLKKEWDKYINNILDKLKNVLKYLNNCNYEKSILMKIGNTIAHENGYYYIDIELKANAKAIINQKDKIYFTQNFTQI